MIKAEGGETVLIETWDELKPEGRFLFLSTKPPKFIENPKLTVFKV
jgi:hypothetical protein